MNTLCRVQTSRLRIGAALFVALVLFGCAAHEKPTSTVPTKPQPTLAEVDLTGAHLDKRKFLLGISMLGRSVKEDIEILRLMTGHTFEPKDQGLILSSGSRRMSMTAPLSQAAPMLVGGTYAYTVDATQAINSTTASLTFNKDVVCVSLEDLTSVYGKPARILTGPSNSPPGTLHGGAGPSEIWDVIYQFSAGGEAVFAFSSDVCVNRVTHSSRH